MKTKILFGATLLLVSAFFLTARYMSACRLPSDFRDAPGPEKAAEDLQNTVPGGGDFSLEVPSPDAAVPVAAATPETGGAAEQGAQRRYSENDPWHRRLAEALGIDYPCAVEAKHIGAVRQQTEKLTLDDGRRKESVIVKHYSLRSVRPKELSPDKHGAVFHFSFFNYTDVTKMFNNGLAMTEKFRKAGLRTLDIVLADASTDPKKPVVVTKFLKGTGLAAILEAALRSDAGAMHLVKKLGSALAAAHRNNLSVGDLNSGNVMFADGEPYFIDLDRAQMGIDKGWDIAMFFYYPILTGEMDGDPQACALLAGRFLQGYLAGGGEASVVKDALSWRYIARFGRIYAVKGRNLTHAVRQEMQKAAGEDPSQDRQEALGLTQLR